MAAYVTKDPKRQAEPAARDDCVLDLVHLSRQTLGDRGLEMELLRLFERQCEQILNRLQKVSGGDRRQCEDLAHTLKGSARAVGAKAVADAAERYEQALGEPLADERVAAYFAALSAACRDARRQAAKLLADG